MVIFIHIIPQNIYHKDEIKNIEDVFQIKYSTASILLAAVLNIAHWRWKVHLPSRLLLTLHHSELSTTK